MRILLLHNLKISNPLFLDLVRHLMEARYTVLVYDFHQSKIFNPETNVTSPIAPMWLEWVTRLKFLRRFFIPLINKRCINKEFKKGDIVNIHFINKSYIRYLDLIKKRNCSIVSTIWGSDYLRAPTKALIQYPKLFAKSDAITMVKGVQEIFIERYPEYNNKIRNTYFGLKELKYIKEVKRIDVENFKKTNHIPLSKIVITVGYNASPFQQHDKIFEAVKKLSQSTKASIHLLIPIAYGGDQDYKNKLKRQAGGLGVSYTFLEKKLQNHELAQLRSSSDIVVNIQETDAFSGSLAESLAAGNLLIVGEWLPYSIYDDWGVQLTKSSLQNLTTNIEIALKALDKWESVGNFNSKIIMTKLNWSTCIKSWEEVYKEIR